MRPYPWAPGLRVLLLQHGHHRGGIRGQLIGPWRILALGQIIEELRERANNEVQHVRERHEFRLAETQGGPA